MVAPTNDELLSLFTLAALSLVYLTRDIYFYNRSEGQWWKLTRMQVHVLLIYPFWIFLEWMHAIQINRLSSIWVFITALGRHTTSFFTTVGVLNDSFIVTNQQALAYCLGLFITFLWTLFSVLIFGHNQELEAKIIQECSCKAVNTTT